MFFYETLKTNVHTVMFWTPLTFIVYSRQKDYTKYFHTGMGKHEDE